MTTTAPHPTSTGFLWTEKFQGCTGCGNLSTTTVSGVIPGREARSLATHLSFVRGPAAASVPIRHVPYRPVRVGFLFELVRPFTKLHDRTVTFCQLGSSQKHLIFPDWYIAMAVGHDRYDHQSAQKFDYRSDQGIFRQFDKVQRAESCRSHRKGDVYVVQIYGCGECPHPGFHLRFVIRQDSADAEHANPFQVQVGVSAEYR